MEEVLFHFFLLFMANISKIIIYLILPFEIVSFVVYSSIIFNAIMRQFQYGFETDYYPLD